jgi:type II secretory pathway pseudopilin PulG
MPRLTAPFTPPVATAPSGGKLPRFAARKFGFTLVELLTVIVILIILMTITLTVGKGVVVRQNIAKAQSDMHLISTGLEQFKSVYGNYPPGNSSAQLAQEQLAQALTGRARWEKSASGVLVFNATTTMNQNPPFNPIVTETQLSLNVTGDGIDPEALILDPWGNPYWYQYAQKTDFTLPAASKVWQAASYLLICTGPNTNAENPATVNTVFPGSMNTIGVMPNTYMSLAPQSGYLVNGLTD